MIVLQYKSVYMRSLFMTLFTMADLRSHRRSTYEVLRTTRTYVEAWYLHVFKLVLRSLQIFQSSGQIDHQFIIASPAFRVCLPNAFAVRGASRQIKIIWKDDCFTN